MRRDEEDAAGLGWLAVSAIVFGILVSLVRGLIIGSWYETFQMLSRVLRYGVFILYFAFLECIPKKLKPVYLAFGIAILLSIIVFVLSNTIFPNGNPIDNTDEYDAYDYYEEDDISADNDIYCISIPHNQL